MSQADTPYFTNIKICQEEVLLSSTPVVSSMMQKKRASKQYCIIQALRKKEGLKRLLSSDVFQKDIKLFLEKKFRKLTAGLELKALPEYLKNLVSKSERMSALTGYCPAPVIMHISKYLKDAAGHAPSALFLP